MSEKVLSDAERAELQKQLIELQTRLAADEKERARVAEQTREMKFKEANAKAATILANIDGLYRKLAELSRTEGIYIEVSGPGYGSGGWFESGEWASSSSSC